MEGKGEEKEGKEGRKEDVLSPSIYSDLQSQKKTEIIAKKKQKKKQKKTRRKNKIEKLEAALEPIRLIGLDWIGLD